MTLRTWISRFMSKRRRNQASSRNSEAGKFGKSNHLAGFQSGFQAS
jgi:hypothetical protein